MNRANLFVGFSAILPVADCLLFHFSNIQLVCLGIFMFCLIFRFNLEKQACVNCL